MTESILRRMMSDAGQDQLVSYASLVEASEDPDAVVILEGDDGGMIYVVCPVARLRASPRCLQRLLKDLDELAWLPDGQDDMRRIFFESRPVGSGIPGGMGGAMSTGNVWIHKGFMNRGLRTSIKDVLEGRRTEL